MKRRRRGLLLKLDFEKTYNRVDWECLMEVLRVRSLDQDGRRG